MYVFWTNFCVSTCQHVRTLWCIMLVTLVTCFLTMLLRLDVCLLGTLANIQTSNIPSWRGELIEILSSNDVLKVTALPITLIWRDKASPLPSACIIMTWHARPWFSTGGRITLLPFFNVDTLNSTKEQHWQQCSSWACSCWGNIASTYLYSQW